MTPVFQTIFGNSGNCFSACLASLLDYQLEEVPYFRGQQIESQEKNNHLPCMIDLANKWLRGRDLALFELELWEARAKWHYLYDVYCIGIVPSQSVKNGTHAVICQFIQLDKSGITVKVVHDPNPNNEKYICQPNWVSFLIKT